MKKKGSFYKSKHKRLTYQTGSYTQALVAIANSMARMLYHLIKYKELRFKDLGSLKADPRDHQIKRALASLRKLGVEINYHTHQKIIEAKREVVTVL